ncbi:MAG: hypothetical protein ACK5XL_14465, partial [Cyclobacteriaceae bacterium]
PGLAQGRWRVAANQQRTTKHQLKAMQLIKTTDYDRFVPIMSNRELDKRQFCQLLHPAGRAGVQEAEPPVQQVPADEAHRYAAHDRLRQQSARG